ncbi:MAG: hypothetical protein WEA54_00485 [Actinomycetota bacterium]
MTKRSRLLVIGTLGVSAVMGWTGVQLASGGETSSSDLGEARERLEILTSEGLDRLDEMSEDGYTTEELSERTKIKQDIWQAQVEVAELETTDGEGGRP